MLTEAEAVAYLLDRQLLTKVDIVHGGLVVHDLSRRHRNFACRTRDGAGLFIKQSDVRQTTRTLCREAECYQQLSTNAFAFADQYMPRLRCYDPAHDLLVLDYLESAQPLNPHTRGLAPPIAGAAALGRALACLHESQIDESCPAPAPWVLSVCEPSPALLAELSTAAIEVIGIIQQDLNLGDVVKGLLASCTSATAVHGDIRFDNCLIGIHQGVEQSQRFFIVDWELAGGGDPCWDVGAALSEYLGLWTRSLPVASFLSLAESVSLATCPLDSIQPCLAAFWEAYVQHRDRVATEALLRRAIQYCGARLCQSAIESANASTRLTSTVIYTLQLAENILCHPEEAGTRLLDLAVV